MKPKPWSVVSGVGNQVYLERQQDGSRQIIGELNWKFDGEEAEASTRLVAAAPEMFSLLRAASHFIKKNASYYRAAVENVLAKIEKGDPK